VVATLGREKLVDRGHDQPFPRREQRGLDRGRGKFFF